MRALRWILARSGRSLGDFYVEADGQLLRRIAGGVIAGLIFQSSANDVLARLHGTQWAHENVNFEISGIDVELFVRGEGKTGVLPGGVCGLADDDIGSGFDFENGRDEVFGFRLVGVDVVSGGNAE